MVLPITCIDNFYENPDEVVKFAQSLEFKKTPGIYPGLRTDLLSTIDPIFFNSFCNKLFSVFFDYTISEVEWTVKTVFQKIYPFLVNGEKDGKEIQSLNYIGLIGVLIKEIQKLQKINTTYEEKISDLENSINNHEGRIRKLEN